MKNIFQLYYKEGKCKNMILSCWSVAFFLHKRTILSFIMDVDIISRCARSFQWIIVWPRKRYDSENTNRLSLNQIERQTLGERFYVHLVLHGQSLICRCTRLPYSSDSISSIGAAYFYIHCETRRSAKKWESNPSSHNLSEMWPTTSLNVPLICSNRWFHQSKNNST